MNFANPAMLLYLLPLAGLIIFLYLLRMRRKDFKVPAVFLWPSRTTDVRANAPLQKLRFSWLMVLQLIAIALIVGSLARPQTRQEGLAGTVTIFVVDTSASMAANDVGTSRLDEAIARIRSAVSTARPGDRFSLVEAGPTPRVALPLSADTARMRQALDSLRQTDARSDVGGALRLAAALVGAMESGHIVLLSDGAFPEIDNFSQGKAAVHFQQVGVSSNNVAITAIGASDAPEGRKLYCGIKNYHTEAKEVTLSLFADGDVFDSRELTIEPGATVGHSATFSVDSRVLEARIEADDVLASDNRAFALASPGATLRVLLVTKGNIFLERALALDPRVELDKSTSVPDSEKAGGAGQASYDIVVFDDTAEVPVKARGVLSFGAQSSAIASISGSIAGPKVTLTDREHSVVNYVDLTSTFIDKAHKVTPGASARVLIESDKGPLLLASEAEKRHLYVAFSLLDSDFALQVAFPIFIANALDFMASQAASGTLAVQTGKTIALPAETDADGRLTLPNGSSASVSSDSGNYILRDLDRVGKHIFNAGDKQSVFYANLLDEEESNISPADTLRVSDREVAAAQAPARIADFWKPILLFCLLVLACEWWLFAKRS